MANIKPAGMDKVFDFLGANPNGAIWVACSIAAFKGIFRPIFTMRDKHSDPQTKKYAAIREGLTEVVAIPVYIAVPLLLGKAIDKAKKFKNADEVTKKMAKGNAKFLGVCASTLLIPAVCNVIQPPIMKRIQKSAEAKKAVKPLDVTLDGTSTNNLKNPPAVVEKVQAPEKPENNTKLAPVTTLPVNVNSGMKVGG